jgi:hypothetical protein
MYSCKIVADMYVYGCRYVLGTCMHAGTSDSLNSKLFGFSVNRKVLCICVGVHTCAHMSSARVNI